MAHADITHTDVLTLMHSYDTPPEGFDPHSAPHDLLRRHGLPRRPDPEAEPELARLFKRAFIRPADYVKAELAIDPVMSDRDPLGGQDPDFGPSGWGGVAVVTSSLGYSPPEPANTVFGQWVVPEIIPFDPAPAQAITVGFWVGLDGFTNGQVLQAGIAATLTPDFWFPGPANVDWWAWTEWYTTQYRDPAVQVTNFPVATCNTVSFLVCAPQPDHGFVAMQNLTTRQVTSVGITPSTSPGASSRTSRATPARSPSSPSPHPRWLSCNGRAGPRDAQTRDAAGGAQARRGCPAGRQLGGGQTSCSPQGSLTLINLPLAQTDPAG